MEKKVHFKLHKVKKHWVTIAVTGLAVGIISIVNGALLLKRKSEIEF